MKIVIGSESFSPNISGVAIHAELLADNLAKRGHQVYVFAPSKNSKSYYDKEFKDYTVFRVKSVPNPFRNGFRVAFLPKKDIFKHVEIIKPDIIHLQDPTSICSSLLKVAKKNNISVIVTNHFTLDYILSYLPYLKPFHSQIRKILKLYLSRFYNRCNYIFCPTETVRKELLKWNITKPIQAISNGVDLERFFSYSSPSAIRLKYHLPVNKIVLYVGRMNVDKEIETIIKAVPFVLKKINAHFLFVGGGDDLPKIQKLAHKMGVERQITFLGPIDHNSDDLPQLYQVASLFAIASPIETQSIVTLEAMASGLPIVAANAGALPELVINDKNGFLFMPNHYEEMADDIVKILTDEKLAKKMRKNSLEFVLNHQVKDSLLEIEKAYEKIFRTVQ